MNLDEIFFIVYLNLVIEFDGIVIFQFNNQRIIQTTIASDLTCVQ